MGKQKFEQKMIVVMQVRQYVAQMESPVGQLSSCGGCGPGLR